MGPQNDARLLRVPMILREGDFLGIRYHGKSPLNSLNHNFLGEHVWVTFSKHLTQNQGTIPPFKFYMSLLA